VLAGFGMFWGLEGSYPGLYINLFPLAGCLYLIAWLLDHKPSKPVEVDPTKKAQSSKRKNRRIRKT
jgi:hypothetical protein